MVGQCRRLQRCALLRRDVSNSPFFIGSRRLGRTSVQEELERHLVPLLRADRAKFLCAGLLDLSKNCHTLPLSLVANVSHCPGAAAARRAHQVSVCRSASTEQKPLVPNPDLCRHSQQGNWCLWRLLSPLQC